MRVTDLTKQQSVLRNLNNNTSRLQDLQEGMASGRRINKLSDDPIGATQAQDFRTRVSYFQNLQRNIQDNYTWLDRTESELVHVGELLNHAKELMLSQINDSADDASRQVTASEMEDIYESLLQTGNSKLGKLYIFSGSKTLTPPLEESPQIQPALVTHAQGELSLSEQEPFAARFDGHSSNHYIVRITQPGPMGRARYEVSDDGGESWGKEETLLPEISVVNADGQQASKVKLMFSGDQIKAPEGQEPLLFPEGLQWEFEPNPPVKYMGNDDQRKVPTAEDRLAPLNLTARQVFFTDENLPRSVNVFDVLNTVIESLDTNDPHVLEQWLDDMDIAFEQVLRRRADVGAVRKELENQIDKLSGRELNNVKELSEVEDLDFARAMVEMNMADTRQKASLDASARLIQPSLVNFLR